MDHFGIGFETGRHVIADRFELPLKPGQIVAFTGPSGSGKSSLMRAAAESLPGALEVDRPELSDRLLIDALDLPAAEAIALLTACGLGEARLLLRTPAELSDGQRYRFRLALAVSRKPQWIVADEFTAALDRTLAKVIAFNIRRLADRAGIGFLIATTHEDILEDLSAEHHVACALDGPPALQSRPSSPHPSEGAVAEDRLSSQSAAQKKKTISFADRLELTTGTRADWPYFARWHYRSHHLGIVRWVTLLWHGAAPIGICMFTSPPLCLRHRNRFFGLSPRCSRLRIQALNTQLVCLSRVVLHPTYRGAGIASRFVRKACETCPWPWIESLTEMGRFNPFFEKAGFQRLGASAPAIRTRKGHSSLYGSRRHGRKKVLVSRETFEKSRHARPIYYLFDNRKNVPQRDPA